jgi:hypothetical protein
MKILRKRHDKERVGEKKKVKKECVVFLGI